MDRLSRITLPPIQAIMVLLAITVPISVALDNLLLAVLLLLGLVGWGRQALDEMVRNPVARASCLLFGMLLVATLYGPTPWHEALGTLAKYDDLLFVPMFMVAISRESPNHLAQYAFILSMAVVLLISYLLGLGVIKAQHWMWRADAAENAAVFRSYITQSMLMSYAVFLALLHSREKTEMWKRIAFVVFALLGIIDILFLVMGRTGYVVLFALLAWFVWSTLKPYLRAHSKIAGWQLVMAIVMVMAIAMWGTYQASTVLHQRVNEVISEYHAWKPNVANKTSNATSTGERLEYYYNTLQIARLHLPFGVGTGGFADAYAKQVAGTGIVPTHNPHNEYLLLAVQGGLPALALMLYWLYVQWRQAPNLKNSLQSDAARGLVITIAVSCLVNSSLLDHTEGLFFAFMSALLFTNLKKAQL